MTSDSNYRRTLNTKKLSFTIIPKEIQATMKKVKIRELLNQINPELTDISEICTLIETIKGKTEAKI